MHVHRFLLTTAKVCQPAGQSSVHVLMLLLNRDGLVRIAFTRKNKTLGAIFRQSRTLQLLEANHAVVQVRPLLLCSL